MMNEKNGKRYGVLNIGAPYALLSGKWMKDKCDVEATPLVISGRVNRIVALMNGQLDAISVQFSDRVALNAERPNEFPILIKFAKENGLMAGVLVANNSARRKIVLVSGWATVLDNNTEEPVRWPKRPNISHRQEG